MIPLIFVLMNLSRFFAINTILICDNNIMNINCSDESVISITRANYGRFSIAVCNEEAREDIVTDCETMSETTKLLRNR